VSPRYLLPCVCGNKIPVETAQAGQMVSCECGRQLEVPTLLKLRRLETAAEPSVSAAQRRWGGGQSLTVLGLAIVLTAVLGLATCWLYRPPAPEAIFSSQSIERGVENFTLLQAEMAWQDLNLGLADSRPVGPAYRRALQAYWVSKYATVGEAYHGALKQYHIRLGIGLAVLLLGAGLTAAGLVTTRVKARVDQQLSHDEDTET
jgi:hypothetical protein